MTANEAVDAMLAVFKTAWGALGTPPGSFPALYPDVPGSPPTTETVWARVTVRHAAGRTRSLTGGLGTQRYVNTGFVWVQVFAPVGDGLVAGRDASQAIVNAYRDARISVLFRNVRGPLEQGCEGAFERFDVKAEFEYDDVR
jgi:hypothetical protein